MANSPIIKKYFMNPADLQLRSLALEEFASYRATFKSNTNFWASAANDEFWFNDAFSYVINRDNPDDYWYKMRLYETELYNFNINYNETLAQTNLWINAPVYDNKAVIGVVGTAIQLDSFIQSVFADIPKTTSLFFFNKNGEITGATDRKLLEDKILLKTHLPSYASSVEEYLPSLEGSGCKNFFTANSECVLQYVPALDWYMFAYTPLSFGLIRNDVLTAVFVEVFILILFIFVMFNIFIHSLIKPLTEMKAVMDKISDGNFSVQYIYKKSNEIGSLNKGLSHLTHTISEIIENIHSQSLSVRSFNDRQQEGIESGKKLSEKIISQLSQMDVALEHQQQIIMQTTESMEENTRDVHSFESMLSNQQEFITNSSRYVQSLLNCVKQLDGIRQKSGTNMRTLSETSVKGSEYLSEVNSRITDISQYSENLLETNGIISSIASQTNILAMNASIESCTCW